LPGEEEAANDVGAEGCTGVQGTTKLEARAELVLVDSKILARLAGATKDFFIGCFRFDGNRRQRGRALPLLSPLLPFLLLLLLLLLLPPLLRSGFGLFIPFCLLPPLPEFLSNPRLGVSEFSFLHHPSFAFPASDPRSMATDGGTCSRNFQPFSPR